LLQEAAELATDGRVHAMSLTDNPGGGHAIMPDELAQEIQNVGLDCIVHFTCKDLTRNGAISRGYALERMGLRNILALTGDYPKEGYWGLSKPSFDLDAVTLIKLLRDMNEGLVDVDRKGTKAPPCDFFVGACVSPFKFTEAEQMTQYYKLHRKLNAGARFIISQLGYDMRKVQELKQYLDLHGIDVPVIGNVYVLNAGVARTMNKNQVPGAVVPDALLDYLETFPKGKEGRPRFLEHAAKMFTIVRGQYQGVPPRRLRAEAEGLRKSLSEPASCNGRNICRRWSIHRAEGEPVLLLETDPATSLNTTTPSTASCRIAANAPLSRDERSAPSSAQHVGFGWRSAPARRGRGLLRRRPLDREASKEVNGLLPGCGDCAAASRLCPDSSAPEPALALRELPRQVRGLPRPRLHLRPRLQPTEGGRSRGGVARRPRGNAELGAVPPAVMADVLPRSRPHACRRP
jgi:methylenetetrahydrofolate reductase (NADPH)